MGAKEVTGSIKVIQRAAPCPFFWKASNTVLSEVLTDIRVRLAMYTCDSQMKS